jgi:hypothetical protein
LVEMPRVICGCVWPIGAITYGGLSPTTNSSEADVRLSEWELGPSAAARASPWRAACSQCLIDPETSERQRGHQGATLATSDPRLAVELRSAVQRATM